MTEKIKLKQVELNWAYLGEPNTKGDMASGKYEVTVVMTPEQAAQIKEVGLSPRQKIKENGDGRYKICLKSAKEPFVYTKTGAHMTAEEKKKIGNGTLANLFVTIFEVRGQKFAGLGEILVTSLQVFEGTSATALMDEEDTADTSDLIDD